MDQFNYLFVLTSIVLGLGLTNILSAIAVVIKRDASNQKKYDVLYFLWLFALLILNILYWWAFWDFHNLKEWTFTKFVFLLFGPIGLYISTEIYTLDKDEHAGDTKTHYETNRKRFFFFLFLLQLWGIFLGPLLSSNLTYEAFTGNYKPVQYSALLLFILGYFIKNKIFHLIIVLIFLFQIIAVILERYIL